MDDRIIHKIDQNILQIERNSDGQNAFVANVMLEHFSNEFVLKFCFHTSRSHNDMTNGPSISIGLILNGINDSGLRSINNNNKTFDV